MVGEVGIEPTATQFQTEDATVTPRPVLFRKAGQGRLSRLENQ